MNKDLTGGLNESSEFVLAERPAVAETRDAVNVWIESADGEFGMRIGIEAVAEQWDSHDIWLDIAFADGRVISFRESHKPVGTIDENGQSTIRGAGPLTFQCVTPFHLWTAAFNGDAPVTSANNLAQGILLENPPKVSVEFDIDMSMLVPPWVPGSLLADAEQALSGKQGEYMSPRYEQLFCAQGSLRVDGKDYVIAGNGLRIRRQGIRRLDGFWGHCWQSAVFPSGKAFGFNCYPPREDGEPSYNEGYVFDGSGELKAARAVDVPWLDRLQANGDDVSFVIETEDGPVAVAGTTFINTRSIAKGSEVLPPNFPIVQQAHARYSWGDEQACGMVERSSTPDKITN